MPPASKTVRWWRGELVTLLVALLAIVCLAGCQVRTSGQWEVLGPNDDSIVLAMVHDPKVPQLLYASTSAGQVYRTRIEALSVQASTGIPGNAAVPGLVADPRAGGTLFAGTSSGIYFTSDYGDTWKPRGKGLPADDVPQSLALILGPGASTTLYAGTQQHGVYMSTDAGNTWTADATGLPAGANVYGLMYDADTSTLYAALAGGPGVFALPAGATTWVSRGTGLPAKSDVFTMLALGARSASRAGQVLFAGTSQGLFASGDGGQTWHAAGLSSSRVLALAADPTQAGALYAGTDNDIYHTSDAGQHWTPMPAGITHPVAAIVVLTDTNHHPVVFAASGSSILRYPPHASSTGPGGSIIPIVIVVLLLVFLYYYSRRNLRYLRSRFPDRPGGALPPGGTTGDGAGRAKQNGHAPARRPLTRG